MLMRRDVERITADRARRWGLEGRERARPARGRPSRAYPRRPPVMQGEATARSRREQPAGAEASHDATKPWLAVDDVGKAGPGRRRRLNGGPPEFPCKGLLAQASLNRSLNRIANSALAIAHSREGILHSLAARCNTRYRSFRTLSSAGKCPRARTTRRSFAFKDSTLLSGSGVVRRITPPGRRRARRGGPCPGTGRCARTRRKRGRAAASPARRRGAVAARSAAATRPPPRC